MKFVKSKLLNITDPFIRFSYFTEKWLYQKADNIVFSMEGGKDYIVEK